MRQVIAVAATVLSMLALPALPGQAPPSGKKMSPSEKSPPTLDLMGKLPDSLEEMLAAALGSNPEILQAEARVEQAHARLNQARLKVTQEVASVFHEREKLRAIVRARESRAQGLKQQVEVGRADQNSFEAGLADVAEAKSQLAQVEARMRYLLGVGGTVPAGRTGAPSSGKTAASPRPEIPEKIRALLDQTVSIKLGGNLRDFLAKEAIGDQTTIIFDEWALNALPESKRNPPGKDIELKNVPLRAALTAIADLYGIAFVFREYGVLVTTQERAATFNAPTIPEK